MSDAEMIINEKEKELLSLRNIELKNNVLTLKESLKNALIKNSDLMIKFITIKESLKFYKRFNYSSDMEFQKGYEKAFEIFEKLLKGVEIR